MSTSKCLFVRVCMCDAYVLYVYVYMHESRGVLFVGPINVVLR
jgi:hypothetical protein